MGEDVAYRWCFLDDFLMAPLDTAVAFEQIDIILMHVAEDLHFYMAETQAMSFFQT